jgi:hypothetical protein
MSLHAKEGSLSYLLIILCINKKMKFTINGLSQEMLIERGLDAQDALLITWLSDLISSPKIKTLLHDGLTYYWIRYESILEDLPILTIKNTKGIGKKFLELEEKGLLVKHVIKNQAGSFSYFRFTDVIDEMKKRESNKDRHCPKKSSADEFETQANQSLPQKEQTYNQSTNTNPSTKNNYVYTFDDFYAVYPRKVNKDSAMKAWVKIDVELHEKIIEDVKNRVVNHAGWKEQRYIPHPSTYLNQKRWEDEIELQQKSQPPAANRGAGFHKQPMQRPDYSKPVRNGDAIDSTCTVDYT